MPNTFSHFINEMRQNENLHISSRLKAFLKQNGFKCKSAFYGMDEDRIRVLTESGVLLQGYSRRDREHLTDAEKNQFRYMVAYITKELNASMGNNANEQAVTNYDGGALNAYDNGGAVNGQDHGINQMQMIDQVQGN